MKRKTFNSLLLLTAFFFAGFSSLEAQTTQPKKSPKDTASGKIGEANVSIVYSSPSVKGRKIWGELVPYGKVWRAGANEATIIETDKDIQIEGKTLPAGKYSLYAIPGENEWQIVINSQTGQWGIQRGGETTRKTETDVVVVSVKPKAAASLQENLVYDITANGIVLRWENVEVPVSMK